MSEFTKKQLQQIVETDHVQCGDAAAMASQLLASMEQEPVACMYRSGQVVTREECLDDKTFAICCKVETPLYAAPQLPQPAVTYDSLKSKIKGIWWGSCESHIMSDETATAIVEYCRAAMLQGAEPVSQPYKLRDGWVAVPVDLMESLRSAAHFEKQSYAVSFGSHIDTGRWKSEYEELERVCIEADRVMSAAPQQ